MVKCRCNLQIRVSIDDYCQTFVGEFDIPDKGLPCSACSYNSMEFDSSDLSELKKLVSMFQKEVQAQMNQCIESVTSKLEEGLEVNLAIKNLRNLLESNEISPSQIKTTQKEIQDLQLDFQRIHLELLSCTEVIAPKYGRKIFKDFIYRYLNKNETIKYSH